MKRGVAQIEISSIDDIMADIVVLRAKCSESEKEQRECRLALQKEIAALRAKVSAARARCAAADERARIDRQAVHDKEHEIANLWADVDRLIDGDETL